MWQDFFEQCHIVEDWLSATEESLAKISDEVRQPGEDEQMRVIVSLLCIFLMSVLLNRHLVLNALQTVM